MRLFLSLLFLFLTQQLVDAAEFTTILVVRHGEKQSGTGDVPLSEQGQARAVELASIASMFNVSSVYCTNTLRSKQTADPTANSANRHIYETPSRAWANQIIAENRGNAVLIVGHSNTVPIIVRHFGGGSVTVGEEDFDRLIVLRIGDSDTSTIQLRYGIGNHTSPNNAKLPDSELSDFSSGQREGNGKTRVSPLSTRYSASPIEIVASKLHPELGMSTSRMVDTVLSEKLELKRQAISKEPVFERNVTELIERSLVANSLDTKRRGSQYGQDFIIGDEAANRDVLNEFFSTVLIGWNDSNGEASSRVCTGVVIAPNVILTASHCQTDPPDFIYSAKSLLPPKPDAFIPLTKTIIQHPSLDLALLKLEREVDFAPAQIASANSLFGFSDATVVGYGYSEEVSASSRFGLGAGIRRRVTVPIRSYVNTEADALKFKAKQNQEFILGGTLAGATCFGDSGGPAFVMTDGGWRLLGITSSSLPPELWLDPNKACGSGSKSVRCDEAEIRDWIGVNVENMRRP
jgi:phosphohistidine phosphatase SixA